MAVVSAEAAGVKRDDRRSVPRGTPPVRLRIPRQSIGFVGLALAAAATLLELPAGYLVAIAGGWLVGIAGAPPAPDDSDLVRRDELLRARERALANREQDVDRVLMALLLRADGRPGPAHDEPPTGEPEPAAAEPRGAGPRRPGLHAVGRGGDDFPDAAHAFIDDPDEG